MTYNEDTKEFTVEASEEGDTFSLTPQLYALIYKKTPKISGQKALNWVRSRIEPPERPEMPDILKAAGLTKYDEFGLLMYHKGRSVRDKMYLEEITDYKSRG